MKHCNNCSTLTRKVFHPGDCPAKRKSGVYLWMKDDERPIEKADKFLRRMGEKKGAKGWI